MMDEKSEQNINFDMLKIKTNIEKRLGINKVIEKDSQILEQKIQHANENLKKDKKVKNGLKKILISFSKIGKKTFPHKKILLQKKLLDKCQLFIIIF